MTFISSPQVGAQNLYLAWLESALNGMAEGIRSYVMYAQEGAPDEAVEIYQSFSIAWDASQIILFEDSRYAPRPIITNFLSEQPTGTYEDFLLFWNEAEPESYASALLDVYEGRSDGDGLLEEFGKAFSDEDEEDEDFF